MYPPIVSICFRSLRFFAVVVLLLGAVKAGYGQRVYATSASSSGSGVSDPNSAVSPDGVTAPTTTLLARIAVSSSLIGGSQTGAIRLQFSGSIPQNGTVFLRVANELTGGVTGGSIAVTALNNGTVVTSYAVKITTIDGWQLYSLNVSGGFFNQVQISATSNALGGSASVNVYYAFYEPTTTDCATVLSTSTGLTGVGSGTISAPQNAIDGNLDTYATFSLNLGLLVTLSQTVYFSNVSNPGEAVTATFSVPDGILSLDLLGDIQIAAYRGNTLVSSENLSSLLTADLLGLLNDNERYSVSFVPTGVFDRVVVSMSSTAGLLAELRLHEVQRTPAEPEIPDLDPRIIYLCEGETASVSAQSMTGSVIRWYDAINNGDLLQQSSSNTDTYIVGPYPVGTTYLYATAAWDTDCPAESERVEIEIIVSERPPSPNITLHPDSPY